MTQDTSQNRDVGSELRGDAERAGQRLADDTREFARDTADRVRSEAEGRATRAKDSVATEMSGIAKALRTAAGELREGSPQERTFAQIAESFADASEAVRDRDLGQIAHDVSGFARRNPLAFLGGAALAGFAVTRFAKASAKPRPGEYGTGGSSYGDSDLPPMPATPSASPAPTPSSATGSMTGAPTGTTGSSAAQAATGASPAASRSTPSGSAASGGSTGGDPVTAPYVSTAGGAAVPPTNPAGTASPTPRPGTGSNDGEK
ncbi:hypothetical protein [Roseivivax sp. CAU 1761]